jgi:hypothetical protein
VVGGAGVVALGVGAVFGLMAKSAYDDAESECPSHSGCSPSALDARDKADTRATISNVGIGIGLVGIGVGVVLLVTHDDGPSPVVARTPRRTGTSNVSVTPFVGADRAGISIQGATF